ncbi:MAG: hypothetical protein M3P04_10730, partial [Actinomycetota bacterium]|nr:hypothetical protein [Actinomycetota bacterium]
MSVEGDVGAAGGLATLDGGSARVVASLDGSPSAYVLAAPYEPGGLVRAVVGQVNTGAGEKVLDVPDAEATSPGKPAHDSVETVPGTTAGPLAVVGGSASADAGPHRAAGTATGLSFAVAGVLTAGGSTSTVELTADSASGTVRQEARSAVANLVVAGVLELTDVVGTARITASGDTHTAVQSLTVGGASVNGQAVSIGNDGVTAAGMPLLPGQTIADATAQANTVLNQAGVTVRTVGGVARHDNRSATADVGGVLITIKTPDLPVGGVAGNTLKVLVGQASLTEADSLALPVEIPPCVCPPATVAGPTGSTTTFVPGTPGLPALPGTSAGAPMVAPTSPVAYVLAGQRLTARTALIAFAVWQLLSLGIPTLYALVERRRRLALAVIA